MIRSIGLVLIALGCWHALVAETLFHGALPNRKSKIGLRMDVHSEAVGGNGYQPIELHFSSTGTPFVRDRNVEVLITPIGQDPSVFELTYRRSFSLPEGSQTLVKTILVPRYYDWQTLLVELREDGRPIKGGEATFSLGGNLRFQSAGQKVTVGIIQGRDSATQDAPWKVFPDVRTLVTVLGEGPIPEPSMSNAPGQPIAKRLTHQESVQLVRQVQPAWVQYRPIDEDKLPDRWLGYSQLDIILVAAPVIDRIATEQPEQMNELKLWLAAGGSLWTYAIDQGSGAFSGAISLHSVPAHQIIPPAAVDRLLDLSARNDTSELVSNGWGEMTKQSTQYYQTLPVETQSRRQAMQTLSKEQHPFADKGEAAEIAGGLQRGSFGLGEVITIQSEDPFPGSFQFWHSIATLRGPDELQWSSRNGVDPPKGNDHYWSWLIRSVGQPPVKSFVFLNLVFAIFIGPICYRFLSRRRRLYLLYFVAPLVAAIVTCALFSYAMLIDGVSTKHRIRQLTWVDPIHDYNISQSRSTYYRVLGHGQQIDVSGDTAIYPVRHSPVFKGYYGNNQGESQLFGGYTVIDDRQQLDGGFLPTRNQVQYLTSRPHASNEAIEVDWEIETVTNGSTYPIHELMVRDPNGKYWQTSNLASQASVSLQPCSQATERLERMLGAQTLIGPSEIPNLNANNWTIAGSVANQSLLERRLQSWSSQLPENSFIGTAEIDRRQLGIPQARVLDSVHVIMGTLP